MTAQSGSRAWIRWAAALLTMKALRRVALLIGLDPGATMPGQLLTGQRPQATPLLCRRNQLGLWWVC